MGLPNLFFLGERILQIPIVVGSVGIFYPLFHGSLSLTMAKEMQHIL